MSGGLGGLDTLPYGDRGEAGAAGQAGSHPADATERGRHAGGDPPGAARIAGGQEARATVAAARPDAILTDGGSRQRA